MRADSYFLSLFSISSRLFAFFVSVSKQSVFDFFELVLVVAELRLFSRDLSRRVVGRLSLSELGVSAQTRSQFSLLSCVEVAVCRYCAGTRRRVMQSLAASVVHLPINNVTLLCISFTATLLQLKYLVNTKAKQTNYQKHKLTLNLLLSIFAWHRF